MLKRLGPQPGIAMAQAGFPAPFASGLEYSAPARGTWNIVHTGMLIPGAHQIFVCAAGCLRGVVLTAAEMNAQERFSTIEIRESDVLDGDMERLIVDGVEHILEELPQRPPAVLVYTSCIHHFMGCDLALVYRTLRERHPDIDFTDCYMNPVMRKSGLTPDQLMRRQLYAALRERPAQKGKIALLGSDLPTDDSTDFVRMIERAGGAFAELPRCQSYEEYLALSEAEWFLTTVPSARAGGEALAKRLSRRQVYLPFLFDLDRIEEQEKELSALLGVPAPEGGKERAQAALAHARSVIGDAPIAIDYTVVSHPLGLARLLLQSGLRVERVYLDSILGEEKADFDWLREHAPALMLYPTVSPAMRVCARDEGDKVLAVGQKAAYFTGTSHFVNLVEDGGHHGFDGVCRLLADMEDARLTVKDAKKLIQIKGWGCGCCA
ncbi:MAG: nitrogenase component 1 [Eubacteriales bacterium]|nr:nitrogenase component 1 [Eubacteriales bacterium]